MLYAIIVQDREDTEAARQEHRAGHLAHFRNHKDRIALAGPLSGDDACSVGSLVILAADNEAEAAAFIRGDPFYSAGVWNEPIIAAMKCSTFDSEKFV